MDKTLNIAGCVFPRSMTENKRSLYRRFEERGSMREPSSRERQPQGLGIQGAAGRGIRGMI